MTDVITLNDLKENLRFNAKDTDNDKQLQDIVDDANIEIDKAITPYANDVPIEPNTRIFNDMKHTALLYARARWFREIALIDRSDSTIKEYDRKLDTLIKTMIANRTQRTKLMVASYDPRDEKLPLPMQRGLAIFGRYY